MNEKNKRFEICDYNGYENRGKFECLRGTAYTMTIKYTICMLFAKQTYKKYKMPGLNQRGT